MKSKFILCLLLVSSLSFVSCSSDNDSPNNNGDFAFEDKWWYSPDNSTLDIFFNSDGTYESVYVFNGTTMESDGEWEWVDESQKIFRVFNLQGNAVNDYIGKATNLTASSVDIAASLDEGATFTNPYGYVDTND